MTTIHTNDMKTTLLFLGLVLPLAVNAQNYSIDVFTIDGGGGTSAGGTYAVSGTIGQPDAGAMSGGNFSLLGGFWGGVTASPVQPVPGIFIQGSGGTIILRWPNPSTGYVLQQTASMDGFGAWMGVTQPPVINGPYKEVTLTPTGRFCMFRLRKP